MEKMKTMTLEEFIKKNGGVEKASRIVGCSTGTLWRTSHQKTHASDLLKNRLAELNVKIDEREKT